MNNFGLTDHEVAESRRINGSNQISDSNDLIWWVTLKEIVLEPMFILLLTTCFIYLFLGEWKEGVIMGVSLFIVAGISFFQEHRSRGAIEALRKISAAKVSVWREGMIVKLSVDDLVVGDWVKLEEGEIIPADGEVISSNDLSVNESILTGESFALMKNSVDDKNLFRGTLVISGNGLMKVIAVGENTRFGKIGTSIKDAASEKSPLQIQIANFVRYMAWIGGAAFITIVLFNYYKTDDWLTSVLSGLTLAMSILPEEIPVAFSTFLALGSYRLLKKNAVIVKKTQQVETLGAATVICVDKTGTITQNKMTVEFLVDAQADVVYDVRKEIPLPGQLLEYAMWSSEVDPFDPMEKSIHELYAHNNTTDLRKEYKQIHEYPLSGQPPMMTHIFQSTSGNQIIAAKGAPEAILACSDCEETQKNKIVVLCERYATMGYRVLAVGKGKHASAPFPEKQQEIRFDFLGLLIFQDPPKDNIKNTIASFRHAGIGVKMITGDHPETAVAIAKQVQLSKNDKVITGDQIIHLPVEALKILVHETDIFARMYPDAKLRIIEALKENGEIVAMTGDGVNDAPALKVAHIGIAMGHKGSEVAKNTASLVIADDDLAHMVDAIALGRRIYDNLKKAIQYIVSIHVPIIMIVTLPLLIQWKFHHIFSPVHVIFLELIMGPTCSIIYENEPMEPGTMTRPPLTRSVNFLSIKQLMISIIQGLMISLACLGLGYFYMKLQVSEELHRTIIFITLLFSNVLLTLFNRSVTQSILQTIRYKNNLMPSVILISLILLVASLLLPFFRELLELTTICWIDLLICLTAALIGTAWVEVYKFVVRKNKLKLKA